MTDEDFKLLKKRFLFGPQYVTPSKAFMERYGNTRLPFTPGKPYEVKSTFDGYIRVVSDRGLGPVGWYYHDFEYLGAKVVKVRYQ